MKKFFILMLLFSVFAVVGNGAGKKEELPSDCRQILDKNFRGWKFKKILPEITKFVRESKQGAGEPNLITGDWNGDGKKDYAVLIQHGYIALEEDRSIPRYLSIAFVSGKSGFKHFVLDASGDYLVLEKKGAKVYDFDTDRRISLKTDAIFVGIWQKSGRTYVWRKTKFIYYQTSD